VIDAAAGDPAEQFRQIDRELREYGAGLAERPQIVALNKVDLLRSPPTLRVADERIAGVYRLSAASGDGVEDFTRALLAAVPAREEPPPADFLPDYLVYRPEPRRRPYRILRTDRGYRVVGRPPAGEELERALRDAGAKEGDQVEVEGDMLELR
jgi:hypothetical protein